MLTGHLAARLEATEMENTCPSCAQLISHGLKHPYLINISSLQDSQLYRCRCCNSYLHCYLDSWEVISEGRYSRFDNLPHAALHGPESMQTTGRPDYSE
jgi:hypothetical protein